MEDHSGTAPRVSRRGLTPDSAYHHAPFRRYALIYVLLGLLVTTFAVWLEAAAHPLPTTAGSLGAVTPDIPRADGAEPSHWGRVGIITVEKIGVFLFLFGLLNLLLELPDWRRYFEARMVDILMKQEYLKSLDEPTLRRLLTDLLKAQFKNDDIDKEGSFLHYFSEHLHQFISDPYRERVVCEVAVQDADEEHFAVQDKITYTCRASGGRIQERIKWLNEPDEMSQAAVDISVKFPVGHRRAGETEPVDAGTFKQQGDTPLKLDLELTQHADVDGLQVCIESSYRIRKDRFQSWYMAAPTKGFQLTLTFPVSYRIQLQPFVQSPSLCTHTSRQGYEMLQYDSWMLPHDGVAWSYLPVGGGGGETPHAATVHAARIGTP